jgi:preprotein translocase subunit SecG
MLILLFVVHVLIALALIGVIMLQKSEGGALGMGGGGMSGFMTGRSTANLLTRTTAILGAVFFATSILLVMLSNYTRAPRSIVDQGGPLPTSPLNPAAPVVPMAPSPGAPSPGAPAVPGAPSPAAPAQPAPPAGPSAPLAK